MDNNNTLNEGPTVQETPRFPLTSGTIRVELIRDSRWSKVLLILLPLIGVILGTVAWKTIEKRTTRILHPESNLSVMELEESVIKFDGIDGHADLTKFVDKSKIGISFVGFARLGVDLSKAKFDLDRLRSRLIITLPNPEVTEVSVEDAHIWESRTNKEDANKFDKLECDLFNGALKDFRKVAEERYYGDVANRLVKLVLRNYYKRNYPWLEVEFK